MLYFITFMYLKHSFELHCIFLKGKITCTIFHHPFLLNSTQVERRVITQLAMAHERQLIKAGSVLRVAVTNPEDLIADVGQGKVSGDSTKAPGLKLQILQEGSKDRYTDITFDTAENPFCFGFK